MSIDAVARIREASLDPDLRAVAISKWNTVSPSLLTPHDERKPAVSLRVSDAGNCARKLWNQLHGNPEVISSDIQLSKFDIGTVYGAWLAALLAASLERDGYEVACEPEVAYKGIRGHIDLLWRFKGAVGVVEFKSTYWSGVLDPPHERAFYQVMQAVTYALAIVADEALIVTFGPAVANRRGQQNEKMRQDAYQAADYAFDAAEEWARLSAALGDVEPEGDAKEAWRCKGCQVVRCERNPAYQEAVNA